MDPLAEKYPGLNPYNYTLNNPVTLFDPQGASVEAVQDTNGTIVVNASSYFVDNDPTLYVYDVEGNLVEVYDLTDPGNMDILQQLDAIARGMELEGETIAGSLYLNPEPMGQLALAAAWLAVGGVVTGAAMEALPGNYLINQYTLSKLNSARIDILNRYLLNQIKVNEFAIGFLFD